MNVKVMRKVPSFCTGLAAVTFLKKQKNPLLRGDRLNREQRLNQGVFWGMRI